MAKPLTVNVSNAMNSGCLTVKVSATGVLWLRVRVWLGIQLIRLSAFVIGSGVALEYEGAKELQECSIPIWTSQKPTTPGYYWWRVNEGIAPEVVELNDQGIFLPIGDWQCPENHGCPGQWWPERLIGPKA